MRLQVCSTLQYTLNEVNLLPFFKSFFLGKYDKHYVEGLYQCIVCHQDLFSSATKFDSGCGWPAFNDVLDKGKITLHKDTSIAGNSIHFL